MNRTGHAELCRLAENSQPTPSASDCEPFREAIEPGLSRGRNAMAIWQDLVAERGFGRGYQTVKAFVRKLHGNRQPQQRAVIFTAPGEESQVDYGSGPMVRESKTGKYRRTRLFVMTLVYSRKAVCLLTLRSSSPIWAELHEKALIAGIGRVRISAKADSALENESRTDKILGQSQDG